MYIVTIAARISSSVLSSEARNASAAPWKRVWMLAGIPSSCCAASMAATASPSDAPGAEVERQRHRRELAGVVDHQRGVALDDPGDARQRHLHAGRAAALDAGGAALGRAGRGDVDLAERVRSELVARRRFEHHAILVGLRVDRRDQPLAERVVQGIVDGRDADAEAAGGVAVDVDEGLQAPVLQVAGDVADLRRVLSRSTSFGTHSLEPLGVRVLHDELELRAADAILDGQVLHRLEVDA